MPDPVVVARADHSISRKNIDPDALRVLYRLHEHRFKAYLVGGSVRDLLLGRHPKDFDVGTDAHPYQIKKLFRNCWIIGRRFRLAHIKYGAKTIEVATFRKNMPDAAPDAPGGAPPEDAVVVATSPEPAATVDAQAAPAGPEAGPIHRDNTFGTPEEDAFRRDFTVNGLFYDIGTYAVLDYVGGLEDLERRVIRSIGDPRVRFVEDPVRMLRAAVLGARLGFDLDARVIEAIDEHRALIATASPSRLLEEYYKILRSGAAEACVRALGRLRLLDRITPELASPPAAVWDALAALDRYRQPFAVAPPAFTNTILIGALLGPLGLLDRPAPAPHADPRGDRVSFGILPVARKDIERLRHARQILPRLLDPSLPPRVARGLLHRPAFDDALVWLEIFGDAPDAVARWKEARQHRQAAPRHAPHGHHEPDGHAPHGHAGSPHPHAPAGQDGDGQPPGRRRRRRRRRGRRRGGGGGGGTGGAPPQ